MSRRRSPAWWRSTACSFEVRPGEVHGLARRERGGQVDAAQNPLRRASARAGEQLEFDGAAGDARHRRTTRRSSASSRSTRNSTSIPTMTVAENMFLGREPRAAGRSIDWRPDARRDARASSTARARRSIRGRSVGDLSVAEQQMVEIARRSSMNVAAHHHGRADLGAQPSRGRQAVRDRARPARPGHERSSTSRTGSRR